MKLLKIAGTLVIVVLTVIVSVGSYKAHRQSMHLIEMPPDEVVVLDSIAPKYIELAPKVVNKTKTSEQPVMPATSGPLVFTYEEQNYLLDVAMAEAEGEDSIGKALVMMTVLNRTNQYDAPIGEIIYAPNQFAVYRMGIQPSDNCYEALEMVINGWTESEIEGDWDRSKKILWFCADGYPMYGEPMFKYGGHYFSGL